MTDCHYNYIRLHRYACHIDAATVIDVALSAVCLLGTTMHPAKTAEPIEMPYGTCTQVGARNNVLDGVWVLSEEGAILGW